MHGTQLSAPTHSRTLCPAAATQKRRDSHQKMLMEKQAEAAARRKAGLAAGGDAADGADDVERAAPIEAYHSTSEYPRGTRACALVALAAQV